jgi:hypothetical protein
MVVNNLPIILTNYRGVKFDNKIAPVVKAQKISKYNNNRRTDEQKKDDVKTAAAILRIQQKRKS